MRIEKKLWIALIVFGLFAVGFTGWIFNRSMGGERVSFNNTVRLETEADTAGEIKTKNLVLPEEFDIPRSLLFKTTHTSVQILLDGEEISGMSENRMAEIRNKTLGFVFQHADLLPELTALDNDADYRERTGNPYSPCIFRILWKQHQPLPGNQRGLHLKDPQRQPGHIYYQLRYFIHRTGKSAALFFCNKKQKKNQSRREK